MFDIMIANCWVRTADLWNCKQSLYQLSHNHCPKRDILYCLKLYLFNSQSQAFDLYIRSLALKDFFEQKFLPFFFFVISPSLSLLFAHTFSLSLTLSVILTNKSHFLCILFILYFQQLTWEICNFKSAQWLYSNPGPLVSDANILGTNYAESFYKKLNIPGIFSLTFGLFKQWNLLSDKRD